MKCDNCGQLLRGNNYKIRIKDKDFCEFCDQYVLGLKAEIDRLKAELAAAREDAEAGWSEVNKKNGMLDHANAALAKLRALCAARPKNGLYPEKETYELVGKIDAAGMD